MKSQFHPKEFQGMMFNPERVPEDTDILKFYKEFAKVKEFRLDPGEGIDNNKVMVYILCMYDKNSPYRKKYTDVLKRKIEVAHDCGFEMIEGGNFESPVEDFLKGRNKVVNRKIAAYVRLHRNYKYTYLVMMDESYYTLMLEILGGDTKRIKDAKEAQGELEETLLEMLNRDNNPYLKDEILRYMEDERLALRPEDIAKKLQDGEKPVEIKQPL
jgi:hypothetical protein